MWGFLIGRKTLPSLLKIEHKGKYAEFEKKYCFIMNMKGVLKCKHGVPRSMVMTKFFAWRPFSKWLPYFTDF